MADIENIEIYQGEDKTVTLTVTGVNITGWTLSAVGRRHRLHKGTALISVAGTVTDGPNGVATFAFVDTDTDGLYPGTYYWAAKRTDVGAEEILAAGTFTILPTAAH